LVEALDQGDWGEGNSIQTNGATSFKADIDVFWAVGGIGNGTGKVIDLLEGFNPGVF
jgi:hypothetical protein